VVVLAQEEARMLSHNYVGTEHILLGLVHEGDDVAAKALESLNVSLEAVRQQVEEIIGQGQAAPTGPIPFTPRAKKVLELSLREALQLGDDFIGTEHLLLGLTYEGQGVAGNVLRTMGISLPTMRQTILSVRAVMPPEEPTPSMGDDDLGVPEESRPSGPQPIKARLIETEAHATVLSPEIVFASRSGIRVRLSLVDSRYGDAVRDWLAHVEGDDLDARVTFSEGG
jgi:ATP-dependent Clp protease ATP-binding subunit ClpC